MTDQIISATHPYVDWKLPYRTDNVLLVAALVTIGIPWQVKREGNVIRGNHDSSRDRVIFHLAGEVAIAQGGGKAHLRYNTHQLADMLLKGTLEKTDPEHPLCYAMQGIINRQMLLRHVNTQAPVWHFKKPGGKGITALVHDGHNASLDTISRFFKRSGRHSGKENPLT